MNELPLQFETYYEKQLAIAITLSLSLGLNLSTANRAFAAMDTFKNFVNASGKEKRSPKRDCLNFLEFHMPQ